MSLLQKAQALLHSVGGEAEGSFKIYAANSRTHVFLKANNLPGTPAVDFSIDLPGELDSMVAEVGKMGVSAILGNSSNDTSQTD
jgi:hypothetical protein